MLVTIIESPCRIEWKWDSLGTRLRNICISQRTFRAQNSLKIKKKEWPALPRMRIRTHKHKKVIISSLRNNWVFILKMGCIVSRDVRVLLNTVPARVMTAIPFFTLMLNFSYLYWGGMGGGDQWHVFVILRLRCLSMPNSSRPVVMQHP